MLRQCDRRYCLIVFSTSCTKFEKNKKTKKTCFPRPKPCILVSLCSTRGIEICAIVCCLLLKHGISHISKSHSQPNQANAAAWHYGLEGYLHIKPTKYQCHISMNVFTSHLHAIRHCWTVFINPTKTQKFIFPQLFLHVFFFFFFF